MGCQGTPKKEMPRRTARRFDCLARSSVVGAADPRRREVCLQANTSGRKADGRGGWARRGEHRKVLVCDSRHGSRDGRGMDAAPASTDASS